MKAMILAAGKGVRLRPLTLIKAKPAFSLANIPLIRYTLSFLQRNGVSRVMVNLHHLPETVREAAAGLKEPELFFSYEKELLGTGGALSKVSSFFDEGTFVLVNGDILVDFDLKEALKEHKRKKAKATMVLIPPPERHDYSLVEISPDGFVRRFHRGEGDVARSFVFSGVHILEPELISLLPAGVSEIIPALYLPLIERRERVLGYLAAGFWQEIGTPRLLLRANIELTGLTLPHWIFEIIEKANEVKETEGGRFINDRRVHIPGSVKVRGGVVVGKGSVIEEDVILERSVIGSDVRIGASSSITGSIVFGGAVIPDGTRLVEKIALPLLPRLRSYPEVVEEKGFFSFSL